LAPRSNKKGKPRGFKSKVKARRLERRKPVRIPSKTILIVCEDSKSSPDYFVRLRNELKIKSVTVEICGKECGSAPISVVNYAIERKQEVETSSIRDKYDEIFCVIDIDEHQTDQAIQKARDNDLSMIISNPCFEYWYILHFRKTGKSCPRHKLCSELNNELKQRGCKAYNKSGCDFFDQIYPLTETAIKNAKDILRSQYHNESDLRKCDPSTHVYKIVECMELSAGKR
jgi:hypothetical protein